MCGIIGIISQSSVRKRLLDGLKRLEYRGYDSAGIAVLGAEGITRRRAEGKLTALEALLDREPLDGTTGIGHTRWATHGIPNKANAHPHSDGRVAVVHNGIIENFDPLRTELSDQGIRFDTDTDTEVVVHLISRAYQQSRDPFKALAEVLPRLEGAFALAIIFRDRPHSIAGARKGSPLAVGYGEGEVFLGSDALALAGLTNQLTYLEEGDWVLLEKEQVTLYNAQNLRVNRPVVQSRLSGASIGKGGYRHFMLKEMHEQPVVLGDTLHAYLNPQHHSIHLPELPFDFAHLSRLTISACGTAFYAGLVAKYWFEQLAHLPVEVDIASEFRYREAPLPPNSAALFISQSGETIDTLAALRYVKSLKVPTLSLVNAPESSIAREADGFLQTLAGPEIGVASTKAFTTQLMVLACLAIAAAKARGFLSKAEEARLSHALAEIPAKISEVLAREGELDALARRLIEARAVLFLGRNLMYPIALEGALKLKEISYLHAEGYAAGEMKHGPIALIDKALPVVVCAPSDKLLEKTASNVQEVVARQGQILLFSDQQGLARMAGLSDLTMRLPNAHPFVAPLLYTVPVQLLAYQVAVIKGTDVDQPRNLAKSVTVE